MTDFSVQFKAMKERALNAEQSLTQTQTKLNAAVEALEFIKERQDKFYEDLTPQYDSYVRGFIRSTLKEIKK